MKLYLVQHAEAMAEQQDPDRPLTANGAQNSRTIAEVLKRSGMVSLDKILHSGKLRAQQTAQIFAQELDPGSAVEQASDLGPVDDVTIWAQKAADASGDLMLVGHLPYMSKMASRLLTGDPDKEIVNVQNAGVTCIEVNSEARGTLQWMVVPGLF